MRVVIAGGGNVGTFIAVELAQAGHEVTVVEVDPDRVRPAWRRERAGRRALARRPTPAR